MASKITCPHCNATYKVNQDLPLNRKMRCSKCQEKFTTSENNITYINTKSTSTPKPDRTKTPPTEDTSEAPRAITQQEADTTPTPHPIGTREGEVSSKSVIGRVIGDCRIQKKIGEGGMGKVYLAHHVNLDIPVAVKFLPKEFAQKSPKFVERFIQEARSAARLQHQNVVGVLNVGREKSLHYIVMQYVDGKDLKVQVRGNGAFEFQEAIDIILQICDALSYAKENNIVHRDIKPENIILDKNGAAKLADLGLAKEIEEASDGTTTAGAMGTPAYMAPEQATAAKYADQRSDIYSLGCTFYYMLTGRVPYKASSAMEVIRMHENAEIPNVCDDIEDVPDKLGKIIMRMMAKLPDDRFQTADEVKKALSGKFNTRKVVNTPTVTSRYRKGSNPIGSIIRYTLLGGLLAILAFLAYHKAYFKPGLQFSYYELDDTPTVMPDFITLSPTQSGVATGINLDMTQREDNFAVELRGYIDVPQPGKYTFALATDDGGELWIDKERIIENERRTSDPGAQSTITLASEKYLIKVRLFQGTGSKKLKLQWGRENAKLAPIPDDVLLHQPGTGEFRIKWR